MLLEGLLVLRLLFLLSDFFLIFFIIFLIFEGKFFFGDVIMRVDVLFFVIGVLFWVILLMFF